MNGVRYSRNTRKLTWQVIRDASLFSYDILMNPVYNVAMAAITDAAKSVLSTLAYGTVSLFRCAMFLRCYPFLGSYAPEQKLAMSRWTQRR